MRKVEVSERDLLDLICYARRYVDGRKSYAVKEFNDIYIRIRSDYPDTMRKDQFDHTLKDKGTYFPYAWDGGGESYNRDVKELLNEKGEYDLLLTDM